MRAMGSQITNLTIVHSIVYSGADKKKTSKLRITGLCEGNSPHKGPVTPKMFPLDNVIMRHVCVCVGVYTYSPRHYYRCMDAGFRKQSKANFIQNRSINAID